MHGCGWLVSPRQERATLMSTASYLKRGSSEIKQHYMFGKVLSCCCGRGVLAVRPGVRGPRAAVLINDSLKMSARAPHSSVDLHVARGTQGLLTVRCSAWRWWQWWWCCGHSMPVAPRTSWA